MDTFIPEPVRLVASVLIVLSLFVANVESRKCNTQRDMIGVYEVCDSIDESKVITDNHNRIKRATSLSAKEIETILNKHNDLRRLEPASDMLKLVNTLF